MLSMGKLLRILGWVILSLFLMILILLSYIHFSTKITPPKVASRSLLLQEPIRISDNFYQLGSQWLKKNDLGLWEMYIEGSPFDRGISHGKLAKSLVHEQEVAFDGQIRKMIPSGLYRFFLKYFIVWFNRDLDQFIPLEYKEEIYGVSLSASKDFDKIGPAYQRIMNYHAAHDIGHALQNMSLVGCSSFATWGNKSENERLIIGRNFDFYVGDAFAKNKIILFEKPDEGIPFMMVTWGGMIGVVSGMNLHGLTITLNAVKSDLPTGSATPVSILAREILQYASTIDEAIAIARKRKTFVSESFLIGSAFDGKAISIEKTPDTLDIYYSQENFIICTNHNQSPFLGNTKENILHKSESASGYRYSRLHELIVQTETNSIEQTANILRDPYGLKNKDIGFGNEKAVNQFICHHSIIFEPETRTVWISTNPWQLGQYMAYQLDSIFNNPEIPHSFDLSQNSIQIKADPILSSPTFNNFLQYRRIKEEFINGKAIDPKEVIKLNPEYFYAWEIAGDYYFQLEQLSEALKCYNTALKKEISNEHERIHIQAKIVDCHKRLNN